MQQCFFPSFPLKIHSREFSATVLVHNCQLCITSHAGGSSHHRDIEQVRRCGIEDGRVPGGYAALLRALRRSANRAS